MGRKVRRFGEKSFKLHTLKYSLVNHAVTEKEESGEKSKTRSENGEIKKPHLLFLPSQ